MIKIFSFLVATSLSAAPVITSISPNHGSSTGGNNLIIQGSGFSSAEKVLWGANLSPLPFTIQSDNQIKLLSIPPGAPGWVDLRVVGEDGSYSPLVEGDKYFYTGAKEAMALGCSQCVGGKNRLAFEIIDIDSAQIRSAFPIGENALDGVFTPDGQNLLFSTNYSKSAIYTTALGAPVKSAISSATKPYWNIAIHPNGALVLAAGPSDVAFLDLAASEKRLSSISMDPSFGPFFGIAFKPNGKLAYVISAGSNALCTLNMSAKERPLHLGMDQPIFGGAFDLAIAPDGAYAYVLTNAGTIHQYNTKSDTAAPTSTDRLILLQSVGNAGVGTMAITPNGQYAYVCVPEDTALDRSGSVYPIYLGNPETFGNSCLGIPVPTPLGASRITVTPDGTRALISCSDTLSHVGGGKNEIVVLDIGSKPMTPEKILPPLSLQPQFGVTATLIAPDIGPYASFTATAKSNRLYFDASESFSPIGTIAKYEWDFGDGVTKVTTSPTIEHAYQTLTSRTVKLQVTNSQGTSTKTIYNGKQHYAVGGPWAATTRTVTPPFVSAPVYLKGTQIKKQSDLVNVLTWSAPVASTCTFYKIYRLVEGTPKLIGKVSAKGVLKFEDHKRKKGISYTYRIVGVDRAGNLSEPATITLQS